MYCYFFLHWGYLCPKNIKKREVRLLSYFHAFIIFQYFFAIYVRYFLLQILQTRQTAANVEFTH